MFNIIPVLETIAPIVGGIAGIVGSLSDNSSSSSTPVVIEKPKCEVVDTNQYPQMKMPNIIFNLNLYINGTKLGGCSSGVDEILIETETIQE